MTGRSCTKVDGRWSDPNTSRLPGKRSTMSSPRDQPRSCPSGLVRGPARRRETQRLQRERRMLRLLPMRRNTTRRRNKLFLYFNASVPFDLLVTSYSYILDLENIRNIPDWLVVEMKTNHHHPRLVCHDHQPAPITANTCDSPQPLVISLGCCICSLFLPAVTKQLFFDK